MKKRHQHRLLLISMFAQKIRTIFKKNVITDIFEDEEEKNVLIEVLIHIATYLNGLSV